MSIMKIFVSTCDKYDFMLPGFMHLFNKYWPNNIVNILGFRQPPYDLGNNVIFHSLENKETLPWSTNMFKFFSNINEERIIFLFDDYWLIDYIDITKVQKMNSLMNNPDVVKTDLSKNTFNFKHITEGEFVIATPDAMYRTSTQPCIWRRDYLLKLLSPGLDPWQFELQFNNPFISTGKIIGTKEQIYKYANILYRGRPFKDCIKLINDTDVNELKTQKKWFE